MTAKARETLLQEFDIKQPENKGCDVVRSDSIVAKELFFNDEVMHQLEGLAELLDEGHYMSICNRLKEKGRRQGFAQERLRVCFRWPKRLAVISCR